MRVLATPHAPDPTQLASPQGQKLWKAAQDFEAMALGALLEPMFATIDQSKGVLGGGSGEESWRPMLTQAMAKQVSAAGGLGIALPVFNQLLRQQEAMRATG